MTRPWRLALLLIPATLELVLAVFPGHAQQGPSSARFAFADTTLLRDTLGLTFERLFPVADSLEMTPDSLRAQVIRYRMPIERLVFLSDSLRMPVDSVGPVMERERFNALALSRQRLVKFGYVSGYSVSGKTSTWTNNTDYNLRTGRLFLRNATTISLTRSGDASAMTHSQQRSSITEMSWEILRDFSAGARVGLQRSANFSEPATIYDLSTTSDQYQVSLRARPKLARSLTTELSLYGGPFDEPYTTYQKRGLNAVLNGRLRYLLGSWINEDVRIQATNKFGKARYAGRDETPTRDFTTDVRSALSLLENRPASLRLELAWRKDQSDKPDIIQTKRLVGDSTVIDTTDFLNRNPSGNRKVDLQIRFRRDQDRYLTLSGRLGTSQRLVSDSRDGRFIVRPSTTRESGYSMAGRYVLFGWLAEAQFSEGRPVSDLPKRGTVNRRVGPDTTVDYREEQRSHSRKVDVSFTRVFLGRLTVKASGDVSLTSLRASIIDDSYKAVVDGSLTGTYDRDDYEQGYRLECSYSPLQRFRTNLALDVSRRSQLILPAAGSSRSNEVRTYRADWVWSYRMLPGLTVSQVNQLGAAYTDQLFSATDDRLALTYLTQTNLVAAISPRFNVQITHRSSNQPKGDYATAADGTLEFSQSSERSEYTLSGSLAYSPAPFLTLNVTPYYSGTNSDLTTAGGTLPESRQRNLTMGGGASLNFPVTRRGRLTGDIRRNFQAQRSTSYKNGIAQASPRSEWDFWDGSMQLSWEF